MPNLFWKKPDGLIVNVVEKPFVSEEELESYLVKARGLLGDIFIFKRQIRANSGKDIPDLIGVDKENNIVLIELKNVAVDGNIAPQILQYAIWADRNRDSLRALWLECKDKPDELNIDWNSLSVTVIIIAPEFEASAWSVKKITYPVELLEIRRFASENDEFIVMEQLSEEESQTPRITTAQEEYNEDYYLKNYNRQSVKHFMETVDIVENYCRSKGWNLEKKFTKWYVPFKQGHRVVIGIKWLGTKSFGISFRSKGHAIKRMVREKPEKFRDDSQWGEIIYRIGEHEKFDPHKLDELFEESYKIVSG